MKPLSNRDYLFGVSSKNTLLNEVLIAPSKECDELHIISGYVASSMVKRHLELLDRLNEISGCKTKINVIVGMIPKDGLSTVEHEGFKTIKSSRNDVECSYVMTGKPATHAKLYVWLKSGVPRKAFTGSANYSQNAFFGNQVEMMTEIDPCEAESFFQKYSGDTAYCDHDEIEDMVNIVSEREFRNRVRAIEDNIKQNSDNIVTLTLLTVKGEMGATSSLNWGQRPGREPNQAYIPIPRSVGRSGFFPLKETVFTVMTDDAYILQCVTAGNKKEDPPKQIETSNDNSELGVYFRNRLGVPLGEKVLLEDLKRYGRTDVVFVDLEDGTYYMDFSKPSRHEKHIE